ncbi:TetR/AcrR family transcriptional regulator [Arthrobacter sp. MDT2-2]
MTSARDRILDSFERILIDEGERSATMEAVAASADVSKGGLLYHFRSKEALVDGIAERLEALVLLDREAMLVDPEGAARYYVRTSMYVGSPLDRALVAMARLAQQGHPKAQVVLSLIQKQWLDALEKELQSRSTARAVKLVGDGLYYAAAFSAGEASTEHSSQELEEILKMVDVIVREGTRLDHQL